MGLVALLALFSGEDWTAIINGLLYMAGRVHKRWF